MKHIAVFLASLISVALAATPWIPEQKPDQNWNNIHNSFVNNSLANHDSIKVLFYGDSITAGWNNNGKPVFDEYYAPLGTANYGISADRTEHVLWRIKNGEVERLHPAVCVIKIGTNNINSNDITSIAMGVVYNVVELRERLPNMKVLILGILPRTNEELTQKTSAVNEILKHLDNGNTIRFLDMKEHFYRGGNDFVSEYYTDLLHLTTAGYRKWAEVMDPLFKEMLGSNLIV